MLSKGKTKFIRSLQQQKYRQKYHKIVVEGVKILNEIIDDDLVKIDTICASADWIGQNSSRLARTVELIEVNEKELAGVSTLKSPQNVLAVIDQDSEGSLPSALSDDYCIYLDAIRDPGNLGTLIRTADWFGYKDVFMSSDTVDIHNPKVIQSSMGSVFRVRHKYIDLDELLESIEKPPEIYGAVLGAAPMTAVPKHGKGLIMLGNESRGIRPEYRQYITHPFSISDQLSIGAESLNVAVAGGIICSRFRDK